MIKLGKSPELSKPGMLNTRLTCICLILLPQRHITECFYSSLLNLDSASESSAESIDWKVLTIFYPCSLPILQCKQNWWLNAEKQENRIRNVKEHFQGPILTCAQTAKIMKKSRKSGQESRVSESLQKWFSFILVYLKSPFKYSITSFPFLA